mmetsp:Transcript_11254/g.28484  ORF Transcript_11254/g.28484 Transcript_11254/m.28484 type:complete len:113 (-) Transcript_11254:67-405(-)
MPKRRRKSRSVLFVVMNFCLLRNDTAVPSNDYIIPDVGNELQKVFLQICHHHKGCCIVLLFIQFLQTRARMKRRHPLSNKLEFGEDLVNRSNKNTRKKNLPTDHSRDITVVI